VTLSSVPNSRIPLAYFVTSHGFGHAARAAAVMAALHQQNPKIHFLIFTQTPQWFFKESLGDYFEYESIQTDVGMVQQSPTREDLGASLAALGRFQTGFGDCCRTLAFRLKQSGCCAALCDISPLGLAAARSAGIPSVLIENFTWDWIYDNYGNDIGQALKPFSDFMAEQFSLATIRIQTRPTCLKVPADFYSAPVSRAPKTSAAVVRSRLGINAGESMVTITMGGVRGHFEFFEALAEMPGIRFIIPSVSEEKIIRKNLILLPEHSEHYHPDLLYAADGVIGKLGYSTLAEVYHAGIPFGYVMRPDFPESAPLAAFIESEMAGRKFEEVDFYHGAWAEKVPGLVSLGRKRRLSENGADQIAAFICRRLDLF